MEMLTIKCRQCNAAMQYVEGSNHVKCDYCGTEYILKPNAGNDQSSVRDIEYMGRGSLFRAYVPQGWSLRSFDCDNDTSRLAAICKGLRLDSQNGTQLTFFPFSYYKSFDPNGALGIGFSLRRDYQLDGASLIRYRRLPALEDYALERIKEVYPQAANISVKKVNDMDGFLEKKTSAFIAESAQKLNGKLEGEWGKYDVSFEMNGAKFSALYAVSLVHSERINNESEQPAAEPRQNNNETEAAGKSSSPLKDFINFGMKGGIIGAKKRGENANIPVPNLNISMPKLGEMRGILGSNWGRCFECILVTPDDAAKYNTLFADFCQSLQYQSLYFDLQAEEMRKVEQIQVEGMQQRTQNSIRASQRLQQTLSETSDIVNRGYERRSQIMDDIGRKRSEAIRGVNSYTNTYGDTVEAGVSYEHVYQRGGTYIGSKDGELQLGPDWEELKKN